jgi:hypothetical protein
MIFGYAEEKEIHGPIRKVNYYPFLVELGYDSLTKTSRRRADGGFSFQKNNMEKEQGTKAKIP